MSLILGNDRWGCRPPGRNGLNGRMVERSPLMVRPRSTWTATRHLDWDLFLVLFLATLCRLDAILTATIPGPELLGEGMVQHSRMRQRSRLGIAEE